LKEEQVGCAVVMLSSILKYRLLPQTKIFIVEIFAILKAMEQHNETNCLTALEKVFSSKNSMENKTLNMLAEIRERLKLMWIPAHTRTEGNEVEDKAAKDALNEDILPEYSKESYKING
jgi:hypothetical protein